MQYCGLNTANPMPSIANMGPPATCESAAHTKLPRNPANVESAASPAINNNNNNDNPEPELVPTLQIESTSQNEIEMTETGPT